MRRCLFPAAVATTTVLALTAVVLFLAAVLLGEGPGVDVVEAVYCGLEGPPTDPTPTESIPPG